MIDLRHLRTIKALEKGGSLVEASEMLHLTQSALSYQLKELEDRIGMPLFVRKSRPLRLTNAGQRLLQLSGQVLPLIEKGERDLKQITAGRAGRLYMAIDCHSCFDWLMPSINCFRDNWPDVELDLSTGFSFEPLPVLLRGDLDLVVTSDPEPTDGIHYEPLFRYEVKLALPKEHPLAAEPFVTPQQLKDQTLITYPVAPERMDVFKHFLMPADIQPAEVRTAELTLMVAQLVASGRGVAALPNWALADYVNNGFLRVCSLGEGGLWRTLYASVREEQAGSAYIADFLATARRISFETLQGIKRP
ncbi:MAG: LysR family transcriptional regulator [Porticoccaceae bacterium]|nr:LysR family transcriptional regulator [Porticoccaceae bacterium]